MHGLYLEDLTVGMSAMFGKTVTEADIAAFAGVSGDTNPLHLHDGFAHATRFGQRIAHGMLSGSFISTVVGTKLPGPGSIYVSQTLSFTAPVSIGDTGPANARPFSASTMMRLRRSSGSASSAWLRCGRLPRMRWR